MNNFNYNKTLQAANDNFSKQEYEKAKNILEDIIDKNDENAEVFFLLSRTYVKMEEPGDAIDAAEMAVEFDKRNFRKKISAMNILVKLEEKDKSSSRKGAFLYRFDKRKYNKLIEKGYNFTL